MVFIYWILFAIILWIAGYFVTRLSIPKNLKTEAFIMAPEWLYLVCGKPKVTDFPTGALSIRGIVFQITGMLMVIFILVSKVMDIAGLDILQEYFIVIWLGCLGLGSILSFVLKKVMPLSQ